MNHQRYDSKNRLIIETTALRQPAFSFEEYKDYAFFDANEQRFAERSKLPPSFFNDVSTIRQLLRPSSSRVKKEKIPEQIRRRDHATLEEQMKLLQSIRELEEKLAKAKQTLDKSVNSIRDQSNSTTVVTTNPVTLTKQDYLNLVDLYFYSHNNRFSPEASDASPSPIFLNDYSFSLSADFTQGDESEIADTEDDLNYVSPFPEIEKILKQNQSREIAIMQVFIDLLLDDLSSNRTLYEAYQELPRPGVAYLPKGVVRLFLQRMSTPWVRTHASILRYLALIEDMQEAKLPISVSEWSSAIYLAGRSFNRLKTDEVGRAFSTWRQMEKDAGVRSSHVTFNILFNIAVRAGKFALGETVLTEMHKRNLRLNRMGRVSLMYYHGLRGDGDGVRKAYHDFVEAGDIVDTLVLNCVIASLINAQEPMAAEQVYQRMKDMQATLCKGWSENSGGTLFKQYPEPGGTRIDEQMASNHLGRILERAPHLKRVLPRQHQQLQSLMPLTPDFTTFRTMLAYHATVSGDLDRMTVLISEMLENFDIPLFPVVFQLLFKGFAIHRPKDGPSSKWSTERLKLAWEACRKAIKESQAIFSSKASPTLPSITDLKLAIQSAEESGSHARIAEQSIPKDKKLSLWEELVIDLAAFPRERLKRLQRFHNAQFDDELQAEKLHSPFFQEAHYSAPQPDLDEEEGEYTLPDAVNSTLADSNHPETEIHDDYRDDMHEHEHEHEHEEDKDKPPSFPTGRMDHSSFSSVENMHPRNLAKYRLKATKPLVCWLLRAYARVTGSRAQVEEVWGQVRKVWVPKNKAESDVVFKVLMRCLRDCDRQSGYG